MGLQFVLLGHYKPISGRFVLIIGEAPLCTLTTTARSDGKPAARDDAASRWGFDDRTKRNAGIGNYEVS